MKARFLIFCGSNSLSVRCNVCGESTELPAHLPVNLVVSFVRHHNALCPLELTAPADSRHEGEPVPGVDLGCPQQTLGQADLLT